MTMAVKGGEVSTPGVLFDSTSKLDQKRNDSFEPVNAIKQLPRLFAIDQGQCCARVIPLIDAALRKDTDVQLHSVAASSYLELIGSKNISQTDLFSLFLPAILRYVDHWDSDVRDTWLNVLLDVIKVLPDSELDKLCYYALEKCHVNEEDQRISGLKILGRICSTVNGPESNIANIASTQIWPIVQSLSQDVNSNVRATVCQQLHFISPILNVAVLKRSLIPCIIELARDEDKLVTAEAFEACVKLTAHVPVAVLKTSLLPLIISVAGRVTKVKKMRMVHVRVAANLAPLLSTLHSRGSLEMSTRMEIIKIFKTLALDAKNCKESEEIFCIDVRRICAESLPVFLNFSQLLTKIFEDFVSDRFPEVRKAAAASLAQCASNPALGPMLLRPLQELILDDNETVLYEVINNLTPTVEQLCSHKSFVLMTEPTRLSLANGLLSCGRSINNSRNWRLLEQFYLQIACVVGFLKSHYIFQHFYPRVKERILRSGALPIRHAACKTLLIFLRFNLDSTQRQEMRTWLRDKLLLSKSCYNRMLFVHVCKTAAELFSRDYFNLHFLQSVITLKDDPVVNIRWALATLLPKLADMAKGFSESLELVQITRTAMLEKESDCDVIMALRSSPEINENELSENEDRRRREEEKKLSTMNGLTIARVKQTLGSASRSNSQQSVKPVVGPSIKRPHSFSRTNRTNHVCTCERNALAMGMSWLNLEMELRRELRTFRVYHTNKRGTIFSCSFDQDFYRDAGVLPEQVKPPTPPNPPPQMLAQGGRSKSFVLPSSKTRIPISHRRSMDVNNWSGKNCAGGGNVSRLPVRHVAKTLGDRKV